jgi:hypothetical protein
MHRIGVWPVSSEWYNAVATSKMRIRLLTNARQRKIRNWRFTPISFLNGWLECKSSIYSH